jgi:hypothetical protein
VELLTHWVDARFNYYLPEDKQFEVDRFSRRGEHIDVGPGVGPGGIPGALFERRDHKRTYKTFEAPLEGFITEVGFLLPFEKYTEVRLFAGYHHYDNPYGKDFEGFQARMEARLLPGLIADLEYWDDTYLMGGHWTAGVRVSVPFSLFALARGHNPFEGTSDYFRPRQREFSERMSEMVVRSHRVKTVVSGPVLASDKETVSRTVVVAAPNGAPGFVQVPFE